MGLTSFFKELKRRNIYKVGVVYALTAWVIVQIASVAADTFGAPAWVMKMIITVVVLGFPVALVIAWAFEVTPDGIQRTNASEKGEEPAGASPDDRRFWAGIGVLLLLLTAGWWTYGYLNPDPGDSTQPGEITDRSIAILPLKSIGNGGEALPLASGLHIDLLTRLSNVSALQVTSRTTVEKLADSELTLPQIADSVGARWIMEGSVNRMGDRIQISANLIDPRSDATIWTNTYQRDVTSGDIFAMQGAIAREITQALQTQLSAGEQERIAGAPTDNMQAYTLYARGRRELARYSTSNTETISTALGYFRKAIRQDSTFALAWAGLADAIGYSKAFIRPDSMELPNISHEEAAQRALDLDPNLAEGHSAMGLVGLQQGNSPLAFRQFDKAIELKSSYWEAHHWLGFLSLLTGRLPKALDHLELAVQLNPQHAFARHGLYDAYLADGQAQKSLEEVHLQQELGLEQTSAVGGKVRALINMGRLEEARQILDEQIDHLDIAQPWGAWFRAYRVCIASVQDDFEKAQQNLRDLRAGEVGPEKLASALACSGRSEQALSVYNSMDRNQLLSIGFNVEFRYGTLYELEPLQKDPRYREVLQKANRAWGLNPDGSLPEQTE